MCNFRGVQGDDDTAFARQLVVWNGCTSKLLQIGKETISYVRNRECVADPVITKAYYFVLVK